MAKESRKKVIRRIALERIYRLFEQALLSHKSHPERSKRYVELALSIVKRTRVRMPAELKPYYCKHCHAFLLPGYNSKLRFTKTLMKVTCMHCNYTRKLHLQQSYVKLK